MSFSQQQRGDPPGQLEDPLCRIGVRFLQGKKKKCDRNVRPVLERVKTCGVGVERLQREQTAAQKSDFHGNK